MTIHSPILCPLLVALQFYGLFKQANEGDVNTPKPGMMQFTEKGKWTAWESQKGKSAEDAKKEYVQAFFAVSPLSKPLSLRHIRVRDEMSRVG